jgi:hypothetical protein
MATLKKGECRTGEMQAYIQVPRTFVKAIRLIHYIKFGN